MGRYVLRKAREYIFVRETVRACVRSVCEKTSRKRREKGKGKRVAIWGRKEKETSPEGGRREKKKRKRKKDHQPKPAKSPNRLFVVRWFESKGVFPSHAGGK